MSEDTTVEQTYIYQPTDLEGRPIGGKQVIKYTTQDELVAELEKQNILLIRKLREETRKNRLGILENEELPEGTVRFNGPVEFTPRELSEEERYELARRIVDPTTSAQATQELVEASLGAPLSSIGETLKSIQQDNISLRARVEASAFIGDNPDYYKCPENFEAITSWMARYDLAPIKANFQKAYDTLKAQGVLVEGAALVPEIPVVPTTPAVNEPAEPSVSVEPVVSRIPTGLNRDNSSDVGTATPSAGEDITYTLDGKKYTGLSAVRVMPGDEYKRRLLTDKNFAKLVDELEAKAKKPRG